MARTKTVHTGADAPKMLQVTFPIAKLAEIGRVDPSSGTVKFRVPLGKSFTRLFNQFGWQVPETHTTKQDLEGKLEGGTFKLTSQGKLVEAYVDLGYKTATSFQCLRLEIKGKKGKGFRRELRFTLKIDQEGALAELEAYMFACDNAAGELVINYLAEPVQTTIEVVNIDQLELDAVRAKATSEDED